MEIIKYETEQEAQQIIAAKIALGMFLVEVSNIKEGNFLGFADVPRVDEEQPTPDSLRISQLEADKAAQAVQLAGINADMSSFMDFVLETLNL